MLSEIINILSTGIGAVITWFNQLVTGELWGFVFSFVAMSLAARFLIFPFFGGVLSGGISDMARSFRGLETSKEAQSRRVAERAQREQYYAQRKQYYRRWGR